MLDSCFISLLIGNDCVLFASQLEHTNDSTTNNDIAELIGENY